MDSLFSTDFYAKYLPYIIPVIFSVFVVPALIYFREKLTQVFQNKKRKITIKIPEQSIERGIRFYVLKASGGPDGKVYNQDYKFHMVKGGLQAGVPHHKSHSFEFKCFAKLPDNYSDSDLEVLKKELENMGAVHISEKPNHHNYIWFALPDFPSSGEPYFNNIYYPY